jgi:flagellar protein FliS
MSSDSRIQYLESKVATGSSHRLHLMLIDGAIRFGRRAEEALRRGDPMAAAEPLKRVVDIVGEMLVGVRGQNTELNRKIADFYLFLFRRVAEAKVNDDVDTLAEALTLLEYERETWQMACDKIASQGPEGAQQESPGKGAVPRKMPAMPHLGSHPGSTVNSRLSLEA